MEFDAFLNQAWSDHGEHPREVADRLLASLELVVQSDEIPRFAQLAAHVFGEHLGDWQGGIALVEKLRERPCFLAGTEAEPAIVRAVVTLNLAASGDRSRLEALGRSDQARVLAMAASALAGQRELERATEYFTMALNLLSGVADDDPAHRALAVTGNNLAAELEGKLERAPAETELMLLAAHTARKEWQIAGTWLNVERAEYRLVRSCLEANLAEEAVEHARRCIEICRANSAEAVELFWGHQALALAEHRRKNGAAFKAALDMARQHFEKILGADRDWCRPGLEKIEALSGANSSSCL
jgi:tetratricopeptide (TPR) repeat protein